MVILSGRGAAPVIDSLVTRRGRPLMYSLATASAHGAVGRHEAFCHGLGQHLRPPVRSLS